MTYQRIFWLDDSPNFFDRMESVAQQAALPLDLSTVLRRTTFAFDLEMAIESVQREQFDLYILDCDFPNRASDERRAALDAYIAKVRSEIVDHWREYPRDGDHKDNVDNNGFIFFERHYNLIPLDAKVLVHSMSGAAPVLAYLFDLPIYGKNNDPAEVRRVLLTSFDRREYPPWAHQRFIGKVGDLGKWYEARCPAPTLDCYEYGGRRELIERYLL